MLIIHTPVEHKIGIAISIKIHPNKRNSEIYCKLFFFFFWNFLAVVTMDDVCDWRLQSDWYSPTRLHNSPVEYDFPVRMVGFL